jgi:FSR family fosmidomycin resistance protein-like MFS transporter
VRDAHVRVRSLVFTSLGHFINDGESFLVPVIAAVMVTQRGLTPLDVTLMFLIFYSSSSVLSVYIGNFADVTGKLGPIIAVGLSFVSLGFLGFYLSASYTSGFIFIVFVIVSAFLAGFGGAFYHPLGASVLQSAFQNKSQGRALGINGATGSVGRALYPSLLFLIATFITTFDSIAALAILGFSGSLAIWIGLRTVKLSTPVKQSSERKAKFSEAFNKGIIILTLVSFVRSLAIMGLNSWLSIYISMQKGVGVTHVLGIMLTIMYSAAIIGAPLFGMLVDRFDKRLIFGLSSAGSGVSVIGYLFTSGPLEILFLFLFGFFAFSTFPLVFSISSDYAPEGAASLANALAWGLGVTGGGAVGPVLIGAIIANNYANLGFAFEIMALVTLFSALGAGILPKSKRSTKVSPFA